MLRPSDMVRNWNHYLWKFPKKVIFDPRPEWPNRIRNAIIWKKGKGTEAKIN